MLIKRGGDIKSGEITDQALYLSRRAFMTGSVAGAAALALAPRTARVVPTWTSCRTFRTRQAAVRHIISRRLAIAT